jgi:two-component system sensor histidine kinase ChiS
MNHKDQDTNFRLKMLKKENAILQKKFDRCNRERGELESLFEQTRNLLDIVSQEKLTEEEQKQLTIFRKFVPQEFLQSLNKADWLDIKLGDHVQRDMTVLFNDIRSFTVHSEQMSIEDNFSFINNYLSCISPAIQNNGGFIDKYIGDAVMALFFEPCNGIESAIGMHKVLAVYDKERKKNSLAPIEIGIGLHYGKLMLGIIGVESRMQGTVISPVVNLASRLESITKIFGSAVIVSKQVLEKSRKEYPTRYLGKVVSVLKRLELDIFEILSAECDEIFEKKQKSKSFLEEGLHLYFEKKFTEASVQFMRALKAYPEDKASQFYLKKCANLMITGVVEEWNGAETV